MKNITVKVPASSANLGSGFDSLGIALKLYNYISVTEAESGLIITDVDNPSSHIPKDKTNLVYRAIDAVASLSGNKTGGLKIELKNNIPSSRGLGSSSSAIIGGLMAGNALYGYPFSKEELLNMAVGIEGHADNVSPALYGGFTVSTVKNDKAECLKTVLKDDIKFAAFVPDFPLKTKRARAVLPRFIPFKDAVFNTGRSALLTASLISGDYTYLKTGVSDRLHQKYRKRLIPDFENILNLAYDNSALGVCLSGAGPTVLAIIKSDNNDFSAEVSGVLNKKFKHWRLHILEADNDGAAYVNRMEVF